MARLLALPEVAAGMMRVPGGSAANVMKGLACLAGCGSAAGGGVGDAAAAAAAGTATALAAAQPGAALDVAFVGMVGADAVGAEYRASIAAHGVRPLLLESGSGAPTATCLCLVTPDGQRTMRWACWSDHFAAAPMPASVHAPLRPAWCRRQVHAGAAGGSPTLHRRPCAWFTICLLSAHPSLAGRTCLSAALELSSPSLLPRQLGGTGGTSSSGEASGGSSAAHANGGGARAGSRMALLHCEGYSLYRLPVAAAAMRAAHAAGARVSLDLASFEVVQTCWAALDSLLQVGGRSWVGRCGDRLGLGSSNSRRHWSTWDSEPGWGLQG